MIIFVSKKRLPEELEIANLTVYIKVALYLTLVVTAKFQTPPLEHAPTKAPLFIRLRHPLLLAKIVALQAFSKYRD